MDKEYRIDLAGVGSEDELHDRLEESLPLPEYYGRNLDALYDVVTEFGEGWHIVIMNKSEVDDDVVEYVNDMINTLEDAGDVLDEFEITEDEESDD